MLYQTMKPSSAQSPTKKKKDISPPSNVADLFGSPSSSSSERNILHFTPHNFHQSIAIRFPPQRLPVCQRCKRSYKTRDICRVKKGHTGLPWTTTHVCITLDESCIGMDGNYIQQNQLIARSVQPHPHLNYSSKSELLDPKTPCCAACKKANRTREFCRTIFKHRDLPWNAEFVVLSMSATVTTTMAGSNEEGESTKLSQTSSEGKKKENACSDETVIGSKKENNACPTKAEEGANNEKACSKEVGDQGKKEKNTGSSEVGNAVKRRKKGEKLQDEMNINKIAPSRTFLCMISAKQNLVQWLELGAGQQIVAKTGGPSIPQVNFAAMAMQQQAAVAWQASYYQCLMSNQMMLMQKQQPFAMPQMQMYPGTKTDAPESRGESAPINKKKKMKEEAKAAITNANNQACAEYNEQFMRQQFVSSQMYMQQMMQMQMMQNRQAAIQMHQPGGSGNNKPSSDSPRKKKARKKQGRKERKDKSNDNVDGIVALPLAENPEEDGEMLDWFDASFNVK